MPAFKVITLPDPRLRKESAAVKRNHIHELHNYFTQLAQTMYEYDGIGIAAVQVGDLMRAVIINTESGPLVLINLHIIKYSRETESAEEGCLSVPKVFDHVRRAKKIKISALDIHGKPIKMSASGLFARVIQHEFDHTNGMLFIDRVEKK